MVRAACPDGGACHHECGDTSCFRVVCCAPLTAYGDDWTPEDRAAHPADRLRPSIEALIVTGP